MQEFIDHAHDSNDSTNHSTNRCEESDPSFSIGFGNFHMKRRYFVKEKDPGQTPATSRIDVPQMLRHAVLVGLNHSAIQELVSSWNNL
jgi:hypothetical protein